MYSNQSDELPKYKEMFRKAEKEIKLTDHLIYVTYSVINDTKFLISIADHIITAAKLAVESLLEHERYVKRIEPFPRNFAVMVSIYESKVEAQHQFDRTFARLLRKLLELTEFIKESNMCFRRQEKYILAKNAFAIKTIDLEIIKRYQKNTHNFIEKVGEVLSKD